MSDTSAYWDDYGDFNLTPQYQAVLNDVVQQAITEQGNFLDALFYTVALSWLIYGGIRATDRARWQREITPVLDAAHVSAAERGAAFSRVMHAFNTNSELDTQVEDLNLTADRDFVKLMERSKEFLDSPVVHARWLLSKPDEPTTVTPPEGILKRAVDDAARIGHVEGRVIPSSIEEHGPYDAAQVRSASKSAEQAVGDAEHAYFIGVERGAQRSNTTVQRYLKIPHSGACDWCFLVAGRGYQTAQSVARHKPIDKCGARPVWVEMRGTRKGEAVVKNVDWQDALIEAGYGGLIATAGLSAQEKLNIVRDLIPRPEDFIASIDLGVI